MFDKMKKRARLELVKLIGRSSAKLMTMQIDRAIAEIKRERGIIDKEDSEKKRKK